VSRESTDNPLVIVRIEVREQGHVAYVTVNNPERRNVLGIAGKKRWHKRSFISLKTRPCASRC